MDFEKIESGLLVPVRHKLIVGGRFLGQIVRKGQVIDEFEDANIVVNQGLNYLLNTGVAGTGQLTTWYIGLFSGNYTPQASDTAATISANATEWTNYAESTRQAYTAPSTTTQTLTNSAATATFTQASAGTIYGAFMVSNSQKGGTAGVLLAAAQFSAAKTVASGDLLVMTYTLGMTSA